MTLFKRLTSTFLKAATLSLLATSCALANKQLVIFGDSYSDNGNAFQVSSHTYPGEAYSQGRFSNGPTWASYLAQMLGYDTMNPHEYRNFAYGQAQITGIQSFKTQAPGKPTPSWSFTAPDLPAEISQYLKEGHLYPQQSLYIIFIGTNDTLNYTPTTDSKRNSEFIHHLTTRLDSSIQRLKRMGANNIVIFNIRALQYSPLVHQIGEKLVKKGTFQDYDSYQKQLLLMINTFNHDLKDRYTRDNSIRIYDAFKFDTETILKINAGNYSYQSYRNKFKLKHAEKPCYVNQGNYIERVGKGCHASWEHFFYDRIHPTTYAHQLMAKDLYQFLS